MVKKIIIIAVAIVVCIGIIMFRQSSGKWNNPFEGTNEPEIAYTESQIVNLPMEKVKTLNPITSKDADTYHISKLLFESLFYLDKNLSLVNGLVSDYSYDYDENSVTIRIKRDSYFSTGENVTASDVKYSINSYISAAASGNTVYGSYVSNIKAVTVDRNDNYAVTVKFKSASDMSMENFLFPIVSEKYFSKYSTAKNSMEAFVPVGSGAYAIEKYNDISELILVANEHYSGIQPKNTLHFTVLPDKNDVFPLLEVNTISMGFSKDLWRDTLIADKKITPINFTSNEAEVIGYNFNKETMANKKVRQAIAYAIDAQALNETAYYKNGVLSDTIYYPGYLGIENTGDHYKLNIEKAKKLLADANYLDRDSNGYLEDVNENELTIDILVNGADQSRTIAVEAIKTSIDKLSISCRIVYATTAEDFAGKLQANNFDMFLGGLRMNETYDLRTFLHSGYNNVLGYSNEKLDKLLDDLKSGLTNEEKIETIKSIKAILIDDLPYYCIVYKTYGALKSGCISGDNQGYMFNNFYNDCINWYCKYPIDQPVAKENTSLTDKSVDSETE